MYKKFHGKKVRLRSISAGDLEGIFYWINETRCYLVNKKALVDIDPLRIRTIKEIPCS